MRAQRYRTGKATPDRDCKSWSGVVLYLRPRPRALRVRAAFFAIRFRPAFVRPAHAIAAALLVGIFVFSRSNAFRRLFGIATTPPLSQLCL